MKKFLLFIVLTGVATTLTGQNLLQIPKEKYYQTKKATAGEPVTGMGSKVIPVSPHKTFTGDLIAGMTEYDVQSNAIVSNRLWLFEDRTAAAVWTMGLGDNPAGSERGTGYNYFDGTYWQPVPTERIETGYRCGWPSIAAWGENGEIVISHIADQNHPEGGLLINRRENKGTGNWTQVYLPGPENMGGTAITWPRMTTSGPNHEIIHLLVPAASSEPVAGQSRPLFYLKSENGGDDWTDFTILDEINSDHYSGFSADTYGWAESRGDTIAFVIASPWHDWIIMKSFDNGDEWEKIIVWEHPYPMWDWNSTITTDTIWAPDYSADIAIDNMGKVHTVCGLTRVMHTEPGTSYTFFPWTDGIIYWNEDMEPFTADNQHRALAYENLILDSTLIGGVVSTGTGLLNDLITYPELGMSTMPTITIGKKTNHIYVAWSSLTEDYNNTYNFRHIWIRSKYNGNWSNYVDLNADIVYFLSELIYPVLAGSLYEDGQVEEEPFIIFNEDKKQGLYYLPTPTQDEPTPNTIFSKTDFTVNVDKEYLPVINVSQNNPNPFNETSVISVNLKEKASLRLEICDITGYAVYREDKGKAGPGRVNFKINASTLKPGVYFYTVSADNIRVTKKMIVE